MRRFLAIASALALAAAMAGCSMVPYYSQLKAVADTGIATAVQDRKDFNDKKLAINVAVLCDNSIGAVGRYPDGQIKAFISNLCLGDGAAITVDQLLSVVTVLEAVKGQKMVVKEPPTEPLEEPQP